MWIIFELIPLLFIFFILMLLLNPLMWLFMLFFLPVILLGVLYFLSLEVMLLALINLIVVPKQLWLMFKNPILRKNHALEHATINVLEERYGELRELGGLADNDGFYIFYSDLPLMPQEVLDAAREGLARLKAGERDLAIHERCGTSITITNLILSAILIILLIFGGYFDLLHLLLVFAVAYVASRPLGRLAQRYITTDPEVRDMEIVGVDIRPFVKYMGIPVPVFSNKLFIETRRIPKAVRIFP